MKSLCAPYKMCARPTLMSYQGSKTIYGVGELTAIEYVDKVQTKLMRRHREGTRKQVQGIRAQGARASTNLAGTRYLPTQAGWHAHKQRQGTHRQVQSTRKQGGHGVQAPGPGEMRPTIMVDDGPNEHCVGIKSWLVPEDLE